MTALSAFVILSPLFGVVCAARFVISWSKLLRNRLRHLLLLSVFVIVLFFILKYFIVSLGS